MRSSWRIGVLGGVAAYQLAATAALGEPPQPATVAAEYAPVIAALQREVPQLLADNHVPGAAIALVDDQRAVFVGGFGSTDGTGETPITGETLFSVQSISKTYTATAFLILADRGLVGLDASVPADSALETTSWSSLVMWRVILSSFARRGMAA